MTITTNSLNKDKSIDSLLRADINLEERNEAYMAMLNSNKYDRSKEAFNASKLELEEKLRRNEMEVEDLLSISISISMLLFRKTTRTTK